MDYAILSNTNGYPVSTRFFHGVAVDHVTENFNRLVNRRAGKTAVGSFRETLAKVVSETVGSKSAFIRHFQLCADVCLGSVSFVAETDNIGTVVNQANWIIFPVTELLNGTDIESSALTET